MRLDEKSIFNVARQIESPEAREAYLQQVCEDQSAIADRVRQLLRGFEKQESFLDSPAAHVDVASEVTADHSAVGTQIGPYTLIEQIGEGGMGVVYLAEQTEPVRRKVALKIVKPGMDTREVIGRFEAERQALAMMDHPNIAKVLDAGAVGQAFQPAGRADEGASKGDRQAGKPTPQPGRPYFVMELVQGVPITEYCDQCQLTTRDRLKLFVTVCRAVQHAHQKGIIHRDIKPTNVLVAMQDGRPTPKIIDFGVAKAIGGRLTERTLTSGFAQMLGTPLYMSPEQAELSPLGVDTRSDVYSLSVLLYELLTGATPFDKDRLHTAPYDEVRRTIREEEPPRPSARISTLAADAATTIAEHRRTDTRRLVQAVRGELDWIVMKCLEKDRGRRYESANDLARDVERYLADEPVHACPPSAAYRAKKFVRKHRTGVFAATAVAIVLAIGVTSTTVALARAVAQRDRAIASVAAGCRLIEFAIDPIQEDMALPADSERREYRNRLLDHSIAFYESLDEEARSDPRVRHGLARAYSRRAYYRLIEGEDAATPAENAIELLTPIVKDFPHNVEYRVDLAASHGELGTFFWTRGKRRLSAFERGKAADLARRAILGTLLDNHAHAEFIGDCGLFGNSLHECGRFVDAEEQFMAALDHADATRSSGRQHWKPYPTFAELSVRARYAPLLIDMGRYREAAKQLRIARDLAQEGIASANNESGRLLYGRYLGYVELSAAQLSIVHGTPDETLDHLQTAMRLLEQHTPETSGMILGAYFLGHAHYRRGLALEQMGHLEEAISAYGEAEQRWRSSGIQIGFDHSAWARAAIGELYYALGRPKDGDVHFDSALHQFNQTAEVFSQEPYSIQPLVVFLCVSANAKLRDSDLAVRLAERFLVECESNGPYWRYLGLARWRTGDYVGGEEAVRRCIELRGGGDALDWLLLAGIHHGAGNMEQARSEYEKAQAATANGKPLYYGHIGPARLAGLSAEVAELLGNVAHEQNSH